jgi:hypothetical protein
MTDVREDDDTTDQDDEEILTYTCSDGTWIFLRRINIIAAPKDILCTHAPGVGDPSGLVAVGSAILMPLGRLLLPNQHVRQ